MALTKITSNVVKDDAVTSAKIVDGGIATADIAANAVTSAKIAQNSILTKHIDDGQVTTDQLGADAVTSAKIADDAISEEHLDVTVITGLTEVTAATGDLLMIADISDSNNLKKIPVSSIQAGRLALTGGTITGTVVFNSAPTFNTAITMNSSLNVATTVGIAGTTVIDSSRNLTNIGTISSGAITANGVVTATHTNGTHNISLSPTSTGGVINARNSSGTSVVVMDGRGTPFIDVTGNLKTGGTTRIDSSGNLSNIGTISSGAITTSGNLSMGTNQIIFDNNSQAIQIKDAAGTASYVLYQDNADTLIFGNGTNVEKIRLDTSGNEGALIVDTNGNVGIGEPNPDAPLHITSNTPIISFDESDASQEYRIGSFGGTFALYDSTDSAYRIAVDGAGKVGIGDTSPQDYLEINGSGKGLGGLTISNDTHNHAALSFARSSTATARIFISEPAATHTSQFNFQTSNASGGGANLVTAMVIDENQKVGIGTSSPDTMLHLSAGSTGVAGGGDAAITMTNKFDNPDNSWKIAPVRSGVSNTGLEIRDVTDSRTDMVFDGSGNVGIGTDNPSTKLTIKNDSNNTSFGDNNIITIQNASTTDNSRMGLAFTGNTGIGSGLAVMDAVSYDQSHGKTSLNFSVYSGSWHNDMMVLKEGKVGIGETGPAYPLHVDGTNVSSGGGLANLCLVDRTAYNGTLPGAGITFRGEYTSGGNTTNFATIQGIKENTSSGNYATALRFTTRANGGDLTEKMRITSAGVLESKSHVITGIDNNAFEVKTNHSNNPSAVRVAGSGSINGISGSFQNFTVLNVMQDSGALNSIYAAGNIKTDGNINIGTSGKGISFSPTGDGSGSMSSELLDDYEEGSWTPACGATLSTAVGKYTKIGNQVTVYYHLVTTGGLPTSTSQVIITGLPYTSNSGSLTAAPIYARYYTPNDSSLTSLVYDNESQIRLMNINDQNFDLTIWGELEASGNNSVYIIGSATYMV